MRTLTAVIDNSPSAPSRRSRGVSDGRALSRHSPSVTARAACQIKALRVSECSPVASVTNADPRPTVQAGEAVTCGYAWKYERPLAVDGLEMRLQASRIALRRSLDPCLHRSEWWSGAGSNRRPSAFQV